MDLAPLDPPLRLLACLALSPQSAAVAAESAAVARRLGAQLRFVHVSDGPAPDRDRLAGVLREAGLDPAACEIQVHEGRPADAICDLARREQADLIVAGALEREGLLESLTMGSVARRIARNAPCSVLLLARGQSPAREGFRQVVAAMRPDEYSRQMLRIIAREARRAGTRVLHVVRELNHYETRALRQEAAARRPPHASLEQREQLIHFLDRIDFSGLKLRVECLQSGEGVAAMAYAERCDADLLVYPAPPRRLTLWDRFFNNPSSFVLQEIHCALLFFRPSPHRRPTAEP